MKYAIIFLMLGVLLYGTTARAEQVCPDGCVPTESVAQFIPAPSPEKMRACPAGCVAVETVMKLKEKPREISQKRQSNKPPVLTPAGAAPAVPDPKNITVEAAPDLGDITRGRMLLGPTVQEKIPGQLSLAIHDLQILELQYSPTEYLQLGAIMILPVLGLGGMGTVRLNINASKHIAFGLGGFGGGLSTVGALINDTNRWFAGGHGGVTMMSDGGTMVNIGAIAAVVGQHDALGGYTVVPVPYLGISTPISARWTFVAEFIFPVTDFGGGGDSSNDNDDSDDYDNAETGNWGFNIDLDLDGLDFGNPFMFYYGFRFSKNRVYGDLGFFIPMHRNLIRYLMYCPPGFPYLSFGIRM